MSEGICWYCGRGFQECSMTGKVGITGLLAAVTPSAACLTSHL